MTSSVPPLSELTTIRVGGVPEHLVAPATTAELVETAITVWRTGDEWLLLGGGSNTVASDDGFDGTVIRLVTRGIEELPTSGQTPDGRTIHLKVAAGERWDDLVAHTVAHGWAGIEALSGIPGCAGAAPVQNIGAYGQELSSSLVAIHFLDQDTDQVTRIPASDLELGYRTSRLKQKLQIGIVLAIELQLFEGEGSASGRSMPVAYGQLATALGVSLGDRVELVEVRRAVLELRASKGMVLDAADPDSVSAGSFFTNPIVSENFARGLPAGCPRWPLVADAQDTITPLHGADDDADDRGPAGDETAGGAGGRAAGHGASHDHASEITGAMAKSSGSGAGADAREGAVKLSAAWLIENAGIGRGFALPGSRAAISSKHTLALTNRGGATAAEVAELARFVQGRVLAEFGVLLQPEPVLVGVSL